MSIVYTRKPTYRKPSYNKSPNINWVEIEEAIRFDILLGGVKFLGRTLQEGPVGTITEFEIFLQNRFDYSIIRTDNVACLQNFSDI